MAHEVFVSYSSKDKGTADAVCGYLEAAGVRCWIAPRDILPGRDWGEAIIEAIERSRVMVLVFSANANESPQIKREVERAVNKGVAVVPLRIQDVRPSKSLEYFISTPHWLDAMSPPLEGHLRQLVRTVRAIAGDERDDGGDGRPVRPVEYQAAAARDTERDRFWVAVAAGAGLAFVAAIVIVFSVRRSVPVATRATTAPVAAAGVAPPVAPAPVVAARPKTDEAAETVADIEKLAGRIGLVRKTVGIKPVTALADEDAQAFRAAVDFSNTDAGVKLNAYWNDFERVPGMTALGASEVDVRAFIDAIHVGKDAGDAVALEIEYAARVNRLAAAAREYGVSRGDAAAEEELLKRDIAAAAAAFEGRVRVACLAGVKVAREMAGSLPANAAERLGKLEGVRVGDLTSGAEADGLMAAERAAVDKADAEVKAVEGLKGAHLKDVVARLAAVVPAERRPGADDGEARVVASVRGLRQAGKVKEALALLAAQAEVMSERDPAAEGYYKVAAEYVRHLDGLPAGGGAYVYQLDGQGQYTNDGIFVGDVIVSYNGKDVRDAAELSAAVKENAGAAARVEVVRWDGKGKFLRLTRTLANGEVGGAVRPI